MPPIQVEFINASGVRTQVLDLSELSPHYSGKDRFHVGSMRPEIQAVIPLLQVSRDAYEGSRLWVLNDEILDLELAQKYLIQGEGESQLDWENRLKRVPYPNLYRPSINGYVGLLSNFQVRRLPPSLAADKNVDRQGANLRAFLLECDRRQFLDGWCGVLVEYPQNPQGISGVTPYLTRIDRGNILNWRMDASGQLEMVVIRRSVERPVGVFGWEPVQQYWVLSRSRYLVYEERKGKQGKDFELVSDIPVLVNGRPLPFVPFVFYPLNGVNPLEVMPPLLDVALDNFALYNMVSEHRWNMYLSSLVTFVRSGILRGDGSDVERGGKLPSIKLGNHAVDVPPDGDFKSVETTGAAAASRRQEIEDKKQEILTKSLAFLQGTSGNMSATEAKLRSIQTQSAMSLLATNKASAVEQILMGWCLWSGEEWDPDYGIEFDSAMISLPITPEEKRELRDDVLSGILSIESYWKIIKARGGLPQDLDPEAILEGLGNGRTNDTEEDDAPIPTGEALEGLASRDS